MNGKFIGPMRIELRGDTSKARDFIGLGRQQMGRMLDSMNFIGLKNHVWRREYSAFDLNIETVAMLPLFYILRLYVKPVPDVPDVPVVLNHAFWYDVSGDTDTPKLLFKNETGAWIVLTDVDDYAGRFQNPPEYGAKHYWANDTHVLTWSSNSVYSQGYELTQRPVESGIEIIEHAWLYQGQLHILTMQGHDASVFRRELVLGVDSGSEGWTLVGTPPGLGFGAQNYNVTVAKDGGKIHLNGASTYTYLTVSDTGVDPEVLDKPVSYTIETMPRILRAVNYQWTCDASYGYTFDAYATKSLTSWDDHVFECYHNRSATLLNHFARYAAEGYFEIHDVKLPPGEGDGSGGTWTRTEVLTRRATVKRYTDNLEMVESSYFDVVRNLSAFLDEALWDSLPGYPTFEDFWAAGTTSTDTVTVSAVIVEYFREWGVYTLLFAAGGRRVFVNEPSNTPFVDDLVFEVRELHSNQLLFTQTFEDRTLQYTVSGVSTVEGTTLANPNWELRAQPPSSMAACTVAPSTEGETGVETVQEQTTVELVVDDPVSLRSIARIPGGSVSVIVERDLQRFGAVSNPTGDTAVLLPDEFAYAESVGGIVRQYPL